jgi:hypothetical protein
MRRPADSGEGFACCGPVEQIVTPHARFCPLTEWALTDCKPGRIGSSCLPRTGSTVTFQADIAETLQRHVQQRPLSRSIGRLRARAAARDDGSNTSPFDCNTSRERRANVFQMGREMSEFGRWGPFPDRERRIGVEESTETVGVRFAGRWQEKCTSSLQGSISISEVFR